MALIPGQAPVAHATSGINQQINFQGRLLNNAGAVVADGTYNMEFKIYQDGAGTSSGDPSGTLKWTEDWVYGSGSPDNRVTVKNGYFSASLGSLTALSAVDFNQTTLWLSVNVGNTSTAATFSAASGDGEMLPMKRLSAAPYALQAANAGALGGLTASQFIQNVAPNTTQQTANINLVSGAAANVAAAQIQAVASATAPVLVLKGGATPGTGADLLQLQNSSGTPLAGFDSSGNLRVASSIDTQTATNLTIGGSTATGITLGQATIVQPGSSSITAFVVKSPTTGTNENVLQVDTTNERVGVGVMPIIQGKLNVVTASMPALVVYQGSTSNPIANFTTGGTGTGTVTVGSGSANITGSGTSFTTSFRVGDGIYVASATPQIRVINTITSNTAMTATSTFSSGTSGLSYTIGSLGAGTVTTNGTANLVGSGTSFTTLFTVGDTILINGETPRIINSITNNTHLTATSAFSTNASSLSYMRAGTQNLVLQPTGAIGLNTASPQAALHVLPAGVAQKGLILQDTNGQTANVFEIQDASGTTLDSIDPSGNVNLASGAALKFGGTTVCTVSGCTPTGASGSYINNSTTLQANANIDIQSNSDSNATLTLVNRATQSADIIHVTDSSNNPLFVLDTFGGAHFYSGKVEFDQAVAVGDTPSAGQTLRLTATAASTIGLTVNASIGQTADLVEFNGNNARSVIYNAAGTLAVTAGTNQTADNATITQGNTSGTITNGLLVNRNGTGGTTTNGINITQTNGTLSNGLAFTGTIGLDITRASGTLTIQGGGGVTLSTANASGATGSISIQGGNSSTGTAGNVSIDTGTTSTGTPAVNIGTANAKTIQLGSTSLSSGTQTIAIGNNNTAGGTTDVTIGTGTTASGTTTVQASGALTLTGGATSTWSVGGSNQSLTLQTSGTGTLALQATGAGTIALGNNAQNSTINIGHTGATANTTSVHLADSTGATQTVSIGGTSASSTVSLQGGTGSSAITLSAAASGTIKVGDTNANTISIGAVDVDAASTVNLNYATTGSAARTTLIGSNVGASNTSIYGGTNNINLNVNSSSSGVNIQTQTTNSLTAFQIQNAATENLWRFGTTSTNVVPNPGAESTFGTEWAAYGSNTTISRTTATSWNGYASAQVTVSSSTANVGIKNNLGAALTANTMYTVSFYGKLKSGDPAFSDVAVAYSRDGTAGTEVACATSANYNTRTLVSNGWSRIYCSLTTPVTAGTTSAYLVIRQTAAAARTFYIDGLEVDQTSDIPNAYGEGTLRMDAAITSPTHIQNTEDSTSEFSVQNTAGTNLFAVDATNLAVVIGNGSALPDASPILLIVDNKSTSGDPGGANGAIYYNASSHGLRCYINGVWRNCSDGAVYTQQGIPGGDTISNTTTATAFAESYTVPANDCVAGRNYRLTADGVYGTTGTPQLTLSVKFGSTTVGSTPALNMPNSLANSTPWKLVVDFQCYSGNISTTGPVNVHGALSYATSAAGDGVGVAQFPNSANSSSASFYQLDTTVNEAITLVAQWSAASSSNIIVLHQFTVESLGP